MTTAVVLALDGGNSKTDVALVDLRGSVLAAVRGPGSSPHLLGLEGALRVVDSLIVEASDDAGIRHNSTHRQVAEVGAWFMAGADLPAEERALHRAIDKLGRTDRNSVANDTFAILRAGAADGWGVAVVVGAGINCVGMSPDGRRARFGSLGAITGDWGGGADIGMAALGAAVRAEDGRIGPTRLRHDVPCHFQRRRATDVAVDVHQGKLDRGRLRELARIVVAAAEADDSAAIEILDRQADEVVAFAVAAIRRLHMTRLDLPVVLGGSIMTALPPRFVSRIEVGVQRVAPGACCAVCYDRPIVGSALAALDLVGADRSAMDRVRATLKDHQIREIRL